MEIAVNTAIISIQNLNKKIAKTKTKTTTVYQGGVRIYLSDEETHGDSDDESDDESEDESDDESEDDTALNLTP